MMRLTMAIWWSLALVWFVTSQAGAEPAPAQIARRLEVKGYGATVEAAQKDALREAVAKLQAELRQEQIDHWQPTEAVVQRHLLDGTGHADADLIIDQMSLSKTWVLTVKIPASDALQSMDRQAVRREVAEVRMGTAIRIVAALALLLAVTVGGIHADEWTRSRYTNLLRLAGAGVIGAAAAGWWWMR